MAEVTVSQLAEVVGAPVERLLRQMKEAGLSHSAAGQAVSDEDKQTLLTFLKRSHGESAEAPQKITLQRKTLSTLKTGSGAGKKTVNIEVRKKRTYIKRDPAEMAAEAAAEERLSAEAAAEVEAPKAAPEPVTEEKAPEPTPEPVAEEKAPEPVPVKEEPVPAQVAAPANKTDEYREVVEEVVDVDPEVLRQRAILRRKEEEKRVQERRAEVLADKKRDEDKRKAKSQAPANTPAAAPAGKAAGDAEKPAPRHHRRAAPSDNAAADDDRPRRKGGKSRGNKRDDLDGAGSFGGRRKKKTLKSLLSR